MIIIIICVIAMLTNKFMVNWRTHDEVEINQPFRTFIILTGYKLNCVHKLLCTIRDRKKHEVAQKEKCAQSRFKVHMYYWIGSKNVLLFLLQNGNWTKWEKRSNHVNFKMIRQQIMKPNDLNDQKKQCFQV